MKRINKNQWLKIIEGANLLGTGGGGTISGAKNILKRIIKPVRIINLSELSDNQLTCTVFGIGGKQNCDPILASRIAIKKFQTILKKQISAIIPVEIGPMAITNAMFIASELNIPILNSDIVGMRSSPEIYLETISIPDLLRTPCVISDGKISKNFTKNLSLEKMEKVFRDFAVSTGGDAIVAGYPLLVKNIKNILPKKSISFALKNGTLLRKIKTKQITLNSFCQKTNWKIMGKGKIIKMKTDNNKGFTQGKYIIKNNYEEFEIFFKNENLILLKNNKVILTCPDSISMIDMQTWQALNNFDENINMNVIILGREAVPIWRSKIGLKLFSPKNLGLNFKQKLL